MGLNNGTLCFLHGKYDRNRHLGRVFLTSGFFQPSHLLIYPFDKFSLKGVIVHRVPGFFTVVTQNKFVVFMLQMNILLHHPLYRVHQ